MSLSPKSHSSGGGGSADETFTVKSQKSRDNN